MQTAVQRMTREDYLAFEEASEVKHEFFDGEVFAMTVGSFRHLSIAVNILSTLKSHLKVGNCCFDWVDSGVFELGRYLRRSLINLAVSAPWRE